MSATAKCRLSAVLVMLVTSPFLAHAEVDPDKAHSSSGVEPANRGSVCLGGSCLLRPYIEYASQPHDCSKAGGSQRIRYDYDFDSFDARDRLQMPPFEDAWRKYYDGSGIVFPSGGFGLDDFPSTSNSNDSFGSDKDPLKFNWDDYKDLSVDYGISYLGRNNFGSVNVEMPTGTQIPDNLSQYVAQQYDLGGSTHSSLLFNQQYLGDVRISLQSAGIPFEINGCRIVLVPTDPNFLRSGRNGGNSWGEREDDQWAIKRVGLTADEDSAWNLLPETTSPVIVAVIDSGLDWHHRDIAAENVWRNSAEDPNNGIDDDNNGYVDDVIGWNFLDSNNKPWDFDGHGTVVTGIIAAAHNDSGIAGINPHVQVMVLKAVNDFGTTRASYIAEAIVYAVDNGARIINISVGGSSASRMEQAAIDYAAQAGVLVVAASGNEGIELADFGPGGNNNVLTIGATYLDDRAAAFSNYGDKVDLVAPGVDVLSLRARYTDANFRPGPDGTGEYAIGDNYVGDDKRYLRVSGTSFSTPIVSGIASLLLSKNPSLTAAEVKRILIQTATDVESPGKDQYTGFGMVNARNALAVDPDFSVTAEITRVELYPADSPQFVRVFGTIDATGFKRAWMQIGAGENPGGWRFVGPKRKFPIRDGMLGMIPVRNFDGADVWQIVVNVEHKNGVVKRAAFPYAVN